MIFSLFNAQQQYVLAEWLEIGDISCLDVATTSKTLRDMLLYRFTQLIFRGFARCTQDFINWSKQRRIRIERIVLDGFPNEHQQSLCMHAKCIVTRQLSISAIVEACSTWTDLLKLELNVGSTYSTVFDSHGILLDNLTKLKYLNEIKFHGLVSNVLLVDWLLTHSTTFKMHWNDCMWIVEPRSLASIIKPIFLQHRMICNNLKIGSEHDYCIINDMKDISYTEKQQVEGYFEVRSQLPMQCDWIDFVGSKNITELNLAANTLTHQHVKQVALLSNSLRALSIPSEQLEHTEEFYHMLRSLVQLERLNTIRLQWRNADAFLLLCRWSSFPPYVVEWVSDVAAPTTLVLVTCTATHGSQLSSLTCVLPSVTALSMRYCSGEHVPIFLRIPTCLRSLSTTTCNVTVADLRAMLDTRKQQLQHLVFDSCDKAHPARCEALGIDLSEYSDVAYVKAAEKITIGSLVTMWSALKHITYFAVQGVTIDTAAKRAALCDDITKTLSLPEYTSMFHLLQKLQITELDNQAKVYPPAMMKLLPILASQLRILHIRQVEESIHFLGVVVSVMSHARARQALDFVVFIAQLCPHLIHFAFEATSHSLSPVTHPCESVLLTVREYGAALSALLRSCKELKYVALYGLGYHRPPASRSSQASSPLLRAATEAARGTEKLFLHVPVAIASLEAILAAVPAVHSLSLYTAAQQQEVVTERQNFWFADTAYLSSIPATTSSATSGFPSLKQLKEVYVTDHGKNCAPALMTLLPYLTELEFIDIRGHAANNIADILVSLQNSVSTLREVRFSVRGAAAVLPPEDLISFIKKCSNLRQFTVQGYPHAVNQMMERVRAECSRPRLKILFYNWY